MKYYIRLMIGNKALFWETGTGWVANPEPQSSEFASDVAVNNAELYRKCLRGVLEKGTFEISLVMAS